MDILLVHPRYDREKILGIGWSGTCLIFSILGIPLFLRGLVLEGTAMLMLGLSALVTTAQPVNDICIASCATLSLGHYIGLLALLCSIYFGRNANQMGLNILLDKGWLISSRNSAETTLLSKTLLGDRTNESRVYESTN